jgi:hypothetical protein
MADEGSAHYTAPIADPHLPHGQHLARLQGLAEERVIPLAPEDAEALRWALRVIEVNRRAVRGLLTRSQLDPDVGWLISPGTESFERLCDAEAAFLGCDVAMIRDQRGKDLQPEYRRRQPQVVELRSRIDELECELEEARHAR